MAEGGTIHNMVMVRDPMGNTGYSGDWNKEDAAWTSVLLAAMTSATGISDLTSAALDGVFMTPIENLVAAKCFGYYYRGIQRYTTSAIKPNKWIDFENSDEEFHEYTFTVGSASIPDILLCFTVETYYLDMLS